MDSNNKVLSRIFFLIIGVAVGWLVWGRTPNTFLRGGHVMPDGSMMANDVSMADMMSSMNAALVGKERDAFDETFLSEMIVHHQGAVQMAELALPNAKHQEIKDLAAAIIATQNKEIEMMKGWQKTWYGN